MKLLEPIRVGNLTLKNRIMFPPLTTAYEERDGSIGKRSLAFYERLAKGGVGYVTIGDVAPVNTASPTPKLFDDRQIPTFQRLADTLHKYDCKVGVQLFHPEYDVPAVGKFMIGSRMAAMEAQQAKEAGNMELFQQKMAESQELGKQSYAKIHYDMQHFITEATTKQLDDIKEAIVQSAIRAKKAGIDAIEVHGDRLLGSLCSTLLNHREDAYGGSLENRTRYALEVVRALKEAVPELMIEYKLPIITVNEDGSLRGKGGLLEAEAIPFAKSLEAAGVDLLQVAQANHTGNMGDTIPPMGSVPYNWVLPTAHKIKQAVTIPVATVGRVISVEAGERILQNGEADLIGYGRSLLCDPDIAKKAASGEPIRECLNCNKGCVDAISSRKYISCVLNAENGDEETIFLQPVTEPKQVVVVGGGIAGLEAARVAATRGHHVDLYEQGQQLGGQILIAGKPPRKSEILRSIAYYEKILPTLDVNVHLGTPCTKEQMNQADAVIVAIGAHDFSLPVPGADGSHVVSSWDVLHEDVSLHGHCVVIGGGLVGTETAEYLLKQGCRVSIVEMLDTIAKEESPTILPLIRKDFQEHQVAEYVNTKVKEIACDGQRVIGVHTEDQSELVLDCDYVVMAIGSTKNVMDLEGVTAPIQFVGDCSGERTAGIAEAIRSAYHAANSI